MTLVYFRTLLCKILENKVSFYLIIIIILLYICNISTHESIIYLDDYGNQASTNGQYVPYNPNYIPTSQGYRVEIDSRPIYEMDGQGYRAELDGRPINSNFQTTNYIPHPSHYPQKSNSTMLGTIHSSDSGSDQLGIIETRTPETTTFNPYSHMDKHKVEYIKPVTIGGCLKKKLKKTTETLHTFFENSCQKGLDREAKEKVYYRSTHYIKGYGYISNYQWRLLRRQGYDVINSELIKFKKKSTKSYY